MYEETCGRIFLPATFLLAIAPVLSMAGCNGSTCDATYAEPPPGATDVVHVAPCGTPDGDGSAERPFDTLKAGLDAAHSAPGSTVLVAKGTYPENLNITADVTIVGPGAPDDPNNAAIILQAPQPYSIVVGSGSKATLQGLRINGSVGVGVWAREGASVTLSATVISDIAADKDGVGYGVLATDDAAIILQHTDVSHAAVAGVLISEARGIILQSNLHDNSGPGLRVEKATDQIRVEVTQCVSNTQSGVALLNSRAIILQSKLSDTVADAGGIGDGLLATGLAGVDGSAFPTEIEVHDSTITGNARTGVLASGPAARTIILQNNNDISGNGNGAPMGAGLWLQDGAGSSADSKIEGNTFGQNRYLGVCMRGDTYGIILQNNAITGTVLGTAFSGAESLELGDGVQLLAGASAQVIGNKITGNGRLGLVLDDADGAQTVIQGNEFLTNDEYGIAIQNTSNQPSTSDNTFSGNVLGDVAASPSYAVPTSDLASP